MSSTVINECPIANSADVLLAEKTLEIIRVMEMSLYFLKTRFNDDPDQWMKAMFHVLKLRNLEYLREERHVHSETESLCQTVHDNITRMYSGIEAQKQSNGECDIKSRSDFVSAANSLTTLFRKFTNLLVKTEDSFVNSSDVLKDMKLISENARNFISKYERENVKNAEKNEISRKETSSAIPSKTPLTALILNDDSKTKSSKPSHKEQIVTDSIPYLNPVFSTLNKKIIANITARNVGPSTSTSATQSDNSSISKPWRLHESERSLSVDSLNKNLPISSLMKQLNSSLGDKCDMIEILNDREFYCKVCKCPISAWQNVMAHIQGKPHSKNLGSKKARSKKQPTDGSPNANDDVGEGATQSRSTSNDRGVLQFSTESIPVLRLEL